MSELYITLIIGISALIIGLIIGISALIVGIKLNTTPAKEYNVSESDSIINNYDSIRKEFNRELYNLINGVDHEFEEIFPRDRRPKQSH